jgi:protein-S-isoprenylcysteine O-methyltransferase Ste14
MKRISIIFLLVFAPMLALLLAWLGVKTLRVNPLGWFLLLTGLAYFFGVLIVYGVRRQRFWEAGVAGETQHAESGDRSFWLLALGMAACFYLPPLEYLLFPALIPRTSLLEAGGLTLVILGTVLFIWARRTLGKNYSGHVSVKTEQTLVQTGPYRWIRHPAYSGYLLMALGITIGYSSLAGLVVFFFVLLPGMFYRIQIEEKLLEAFGDEYKSYQQRTGRFFPRIWR